MTKAAIRNFHLPLPGPLYEALRGEAARTGRPATDVAREAILLHLRARRRAAVDRAVAEYAQKQAGGSADVDALLEEAAASQLFGRGGGS